MRDGDWVRAIWDGEGIAARVARGALVPAELVFGAASALWSSLYSAGVFSSAPTALPALSIGNLTVGGTGKTPLAAYVATRMRADGARPAIVLRGYGDDEPIVHRTLNPDVPVVVSPDRVAGSEQAARVGCDVVVFDDAFQHRRAQRVADVVVISADAWTDAPRHLLPAGPWRERLSAVRRASLVAITRKAASQTRADVIAESVAREAQVPTSIVRLDVGELRDLATNATAPIDALAGESVLAITGIGNPGAFHAQLAAHGASVQPVAFRDHHRFTTGDAHTLAAKAARYDRAVCTLKDLVKLGPLWPGPSPLWYVSQRVDVETGADALDAVLKITLDARFASTQRGRPGLPGPPN
ncbi:MAG TPA: tetraacyldisaccharide 4'-kinase [Gemmatimonadaceae bacterium]|nr:tetraacyldisaccharide 4'-kinase [Gemmatimonadaceae bacterium]